MTKEEINQHIQEYIKENLRVGINIGYSYSYSGRRVEVQVFLNDDLISYASDSLPEND